MEIKVLGTVSPYPKGDMKCPSFLINEGDKKIMLDSGFGSSSGLDFYKDLKNLIVIISHYHPDHYGDLLALQYASYVYHKLGYLDDKVQVYLPKAKKSKSNIGGEWQTPLFIPSSPIDYDYLTDSNREGFIEYFHYDEKKTINVDGMKINFTKTKHNINTYAARVECGNESIVYSADTGYQGSDLVNIASNADILLCEATYLKGQEKGNDNHLYASEAGKIAANANVDKLYLFHTFPEINKDKYVSEAKNEFCNVFKTKENEIIKIRKK